jgi:uncharacterized protein
VIADDRLSVLGRATAELEPDRVQWTLAVSEVDTHPSVAFQRCSKRLRKLVAALGDTEVVTGKVAVEDEWHRHGHKQTGRHVASARLTATAPIELAPALAATAMEAGADSLRGPHALYPDHSAAVDELYGAAVTNARATAEQMATAAGRALGRVVSIRDLRSDEPEGRYYLSAVAASGGGDEDGPPVLTRPQRLSVAVAVVFELL